MREMGMARWNWIQLAQGTPTLNDTNNAHNLQVFTSAMLALLITKSYTCTWAMLALLITKSYTCTLRNVFTACTGKTYLYLYQ